MERQQAKRWLVRGTVQGVGFRYFVLRNASPLGLRGWTRNLDNGDVEVYAVGPESKLQELAAALHKGPAAADVRGVEEREESIQNLSGFSVR